MVFSFGNLLRNIAHLAETDPNHFGGNAANMVSPNNNPGTDGQDNYSSDVLARLLSQVTGQQYELQSHGKSSTTQTQAAEVAPLSEVTEHRIQSHNKSSPLGSTIGHTKITKVAPTKDSTAKSHPEEKKLWPIFHPSKPDNTPEAMMQQEGKEEVFDDDDSSFESCTSHPLPDHLFDYPFRERFPNDNDAYTIDSASFKTSWSMLTYEYKNMGNGIRELSQSCLGIYRCPRKDCRFKRNAVTPREKRGRYRLPDKAKGRNQTCEIHGVPLVHQACRARIFLTRSQNDGTTDVQHKGHHSHPYPHEQVSPQAKKWLEGVVVTAPELRPHQIKKGNVTTNRPAARIIHEGFNNPDRIGYYKRQLLNKVGNNFSLADLPKWEEMTGDKFLVEADIRDTDTAIISIQFPEMQNITKKNGGTLPLEEGEDANLYAFQTDTIEKVISDDDYPSMGVTGTTAYSTELKKYVPVLLSVTFGRKLTNYERHWRLLLQGIGYRDLNEFMAKFPGNISDFSDAEKGGFELALRNLFGVEQDDVIGMEVPEDEGLFMDDVGSFGSMGRGIRNEGTYCYIISAIQVLLTFRTEFVIPLHEFFVRHRNELDKQTLTYQFLALAAACLSPTFVGIPTTTNLRKVMETKFPEDFHNMEHQDSGLFLTHFLDALTKELVDVAGEDGMIIPSNVFKFQQLNTYHCHSCNKSSDSMSDTSRDDYNFVLSVSCTSSAMNQMSMRELLDRYVEDSEHVFVREEACPCCGKKNQRTTMHMKIVHPPKIFIILLKRNMSSVENGFLPQKLFTKCELPDNLQSYHFQTIVAHPNIYETQDQGSAADDYSLASVIRHHGRESTEGHFTALANRNGSNMIVFDDAHPVRLPTDEDGHDWTESNWICAAYRSTALAGSSDQSEKFEFDEVFLPSQKFKLQHYYMCCKVHWKRSVARVKRNHALVPPDEMSQNRFQHLVNILASDKTDENRFNETIHNLKAEFPHVTGWIDWYLYNNRGNCFFPFMTQGGIRGFGNNTNAQEGGGRWLQDGIGKKNAPMMEVLQHLYSAGKAINEDVIAIREGKMPSYQRRRSSMSPKERERERKAKRKAYKATASRTRKAKKYKNDGRPPDTTDKLFTPSSLKKQKRAQKKPTGQWNFGPFAMPWSYDIDGIHVTNTCAMDSFLQLLFLMRKYGIIEQRLFHHDEVLTDVLNDIDAGLSHIARHKWVRHVMQVCAESPDISADGKRWSLFGKTCHHSISCKLFQMIVRREYDSCSTNDCPNEALYDTTNEESMASMGHRVTCLDVSGVTAENARYKSLQEFFDSEFHSFLARKTNKERVRKGEQCGLSFKLSERMQKCYGHRKWKQEIVEHPIILELYMYGEFRYRWKSPSEIPQSFNLCGKEYIFCGALLNDSRCSHFRSLVKIEGKFAMYDGMYTKESQRIQWIREAGSFGEGFSVGKAWYVQRKIPGSTEVQQLSQDVKIGIPDGISVKYTMKTHTRHEHLCQECNRETTHFSGPLITVKEAAGSGLQKVSYYHIEECCMTETIKSKKVDVLAAIESSEFPIEGKEMLREKFNSLLNDKFNNDEDSAVIVEEVQKDDNSSRSKMASPIADKDKPSTRWSEEDEKDDDSIRSSSSSSMADKPATRWSLHVGDKIGYTPYFPEINNSKSYVEGFVTKIRLHGIHGHPILETDAEIICSLDYNIWNSFTLVHSDFPDAPPKGTRTSLQEVNLVEGELDKAIMKKVRERVAEETIRATPGGVKKRAALEASFGSTKKQTLQRYSHLTRSVAKANNIKVGGFVGNGEK